MPKKAAPKSNYWLDRVVAEIIKAYPRGELVVASGVAPSGPYHVGHLRELLTADAVAYALKEAGRKAVHLHFVDDFDPFRKPPAGVPQSYEKYKGMPLYLVPDPKQCHKSYAEHYLNEFLQVIKPLKLDMEILESHKLYQAGKFTKAIAQTLDKLDEIRGIIEKVSGRDLPKEWAPVQLLSDNDKLDEWKFAGWNPRTKSITHADGEVGIGKGRVKLNWRLDWPARWSVYGVDVEPFGRDHAAKGGSYDTGEQLVKAVFGGEAPYPIPYEFINPAKTGKKLSASEGNALTPAEVLEVMPAEILRYFVLKSRPQKALVFDAGSGIYNLIEEYSQVEQAVRSGDDHEFRRAYEIASGETKEQTISSIPFTHMVATYQAALGDLRRGKQILIRSGYETVAAGDSAILRREWQFVANWLAKHAPDDVKFEIQQKLPKVELSDRQRQCLAELADELEKNPDMMAETIHNLVYACGQKAGLKPQKAFQAVYRVLLAKDSGPRAGWFLETLDKSFLLKRLRLQA